MSKKIYNILGSICSSCLGWLVFFDLNSMSVLFFGELERPKPETK